MSKARKPAIVLSFCILMAMFAIFILPTTLILIVGLVPSAVAYFADSSKERTLGATVFYLNAAGVVPLLLKLWQHGHTVPFALDLLTRPMMLLLVLVPSACGWLLFQYMPYLVIGILRRKAEATIKTLEKLRAELVEQWGTKVTGDLVRPEALTAPEAPQETGASPPAEKT